MEASADRVLCVDLDGTIVSTDLLWESLLSAVRVRPWVLVLAPLWLLRGRAHMKRRLAESSDIDFSALPYRADTLALITAAHRDGRRVVLATASDALLAAGVSKHLNCFCEVMASDGVVNMKGRTKAAAMVERFGKGQFDYIGDSHADVACWLEAHEALTVGAFPTRRVTGLKRLEAQTGGEPLAPPFSWGMVLRALRPHQWLKNLLLVVPVVTAHRFDLLTLVHLAVAIACFSLCASGGYVLNDLLDLSADRRHHRKKWRPFASGRLSIGVGVAMIVTTWLVGFGVAAILLPPRFTLLLAAYLLCTTVYSLRLKKEPVLDVMFLAGLYVARVVGGGEATGVPVSTWLLAFTLFVCLSLAFMKRYIETSAHAGEDTTPLPGRGYAPSDASWLQSAGLASAYMSVVVLALYVNNPDVSRLYGHPTRLLLLCPILLYWATRTWMSAHRQQLHDDPLVAVAGDPTTYVLGAMAALIVYSAI